jgi:hypothetical protein
MLCCRSIDNKDKMLASCRDAALDGRGYIVVLDDADLIGLLRAVGDGNRIIIDGFLNSRLGLLLT